MNWYLVGLLALLGFTTIVAYGFGLSAGERAARDREQLLLNRIHDLTRGNQ